MLIAIKFTRGFRDASACIRVTGVRFEDASTAPKKKPHPQVYLQTLSRLGLQAAECLAFEDSSNGLQAALGAGLQTIITPNSFTQHHDFARASQVLPDLANVHVAQLQAWHTSNHH